MAVQDDIADRIAGFALFADLSAPQREQVAHQFDEAWFSEGERVPRQGFSGSGLYVILDGAAAIRMTASIEPRSRPATMSAFGGSPSRTE